MKNLTGGYTDAPNGKVGHRSMAQFWQDAIAGNRDRLIAKVVVNGAFFAKYFETVLVFSSTAARQIDAANTLKSFGANRVAMLDGGGSTGLVVEGKNLIDSGTAVPHAIAFYSRR